MVSILAVTTALCAWWQPATRAPVIDRAHIGLWAGHEWVGRSHSADEYRALAQRLSDNHVTEVFFHVGPLRGDGALPPSAYPHAAALLREMAARAPGVRSQAWIGQVTTAGGGAVDLSAPPTRAHVLDAAASALDKGFAGIHVDLEPVHDGDDGYLALLRSLKALTRSRSARLSVATPVPEELAGVAPVAQRILPAYDHWSLGYYAKVSEQADEIDVMAYDTGSPSATIYQRLLSADIEKLQRAVSGRTDLVIGLPTYTDTTWLHHPVAENLASGMAALASSGGRPVGIAIYADWTTSAADWGTLRQVSPP